MASPARQFPLQPLTVEEFLVTNQTAFGPAWRYELVEGVPVGQAAPTNDHAAIIINLGTALSVALQDIPNCRVEAGAAAIPRSKAKSTARIPDVLVRCHDKPRTIFEITSPSDRLRQRNKRLRDLMDVDGVVEIVEIEQDEPACRVFRQAGDIWAIEAIDGPEAVLRLQSLDLEIPLAALYNKVLDLQNEAEQPVSDEPAG